MYRVAFVCSLSISADAPTHRAESYPGILADYHRSSEVVRTLLGEIMLGPHTSFIRDFHGKLAPIRSAEGRRPPTLTTYPECP
jgi:hypothetical protein